MKVQSIYQSISNAALLKKKQLAILIDPDVFVLEKTQDFLEQIPKDATHIFVGGSTVEEYATNTLVELLKIHTQLPIVIFPGDVSQITPAADALLFLSLLSGDNPEYLIGQQTKAVPKLRGTGLATIPTGYVLIDGGNHSAVASVTGTKPMLQNDVQKIVDTAKAGELLGMRLIYLEAGSGATIPVSKTIISAVKNELSIPLIVGGGVRTEVQKQAAYEAGADMVVMGTVFEESQKS